LLKETRKKKVKEKSGVFRKILTIERWGGYLKKKLGGGKKRFFGSKKERKKLNIRDGRVLGKLL